MNSTLLCCDHCGANRTVRHENEQLVVSSRLCSRVEYGQRCPGTLRRPRDMQVGPPEYLGSDIAPMRRGW